MLWTPCVYSPSCTLSTACRCGCRFPTSIAQHGCGDPSITDTVPRVLCYTQGHGGHPCHLPWADGDVVGTRAALGVAVARHKLTDHGALCAVHLPAPEFGLAAVSQWLQQCLYPKGSWLLFPVCQSLHKSDPLLPSCGHSRNHTLCLCPWC